MWSFQDDPSRALRPTRSSNAWQSVILNFVRGACRWLSHDNSYHKDRNFPPRKMYSYESVRVIYSADSTVLQFFSIKSCIRNQSYFASNVAIPRNQSHFASNVATLLVVLAGLTMRNPWSVTALIACFSYAIFMLTFKKMTLVIGRFLYVTGDFCVARELEFHGATYLDNLAIIMGVAESHATHGMTHPLGLCLTMNRSCSLKRWWPRLQRMPELHR